MKFIYNFKKGLHSVQSLHNLTIKSAVLCTMLLSGFQSQLNAQDPLRVRPSWWFGGAIGANFNFYDGSIQTLNADKRAPVAFHKGFGIGLYAAPLLEFHRPESVFGFMLQAGYDNRQGKFDQQFSPCNCPRDLSTKLSYITIEPSLRIAPFKSDFYLFVGPRFAFNMNKSFTYKEGPNPDIPDQVTNPDVKGDLADVKKNIISMQIGAGYDIQLSSENKKTQIVLSPFISYHPYFGQEPRSIETWTVSTLRAGVAIKFGHGSLKDKTVAKKDTAPKVIAVVVVPVKVPVVIPEVKFSVNSPKNNTTIRTVREIFPLRNYVFFNFGSTEIPGRYVLLQKDEAKDFGKNNVALSTPVDMSGRSERQMIVYYNILNILGDRMVKNPETTIMLVGSSEKGQADARIMAESIRKYLVETFGINASRISIEGRDKPKIPSEQGGQKNDIALLREGDRRVSIESSSPALLAEFYTGPTTLTAATEKKVVQEAPAESYVTVNVAGAKDILDTWTLQVKDEKGKVQYFGPYTDEKVTIPGQDILGTSSEGNFKMTMMGKTKAGKPVNMDTTVHVVLWKSSTNEEVMRFSVIYEFNNSKAIAIYEKYLKEVVLPKIPKGGKVIINGYTDIIGEEGYNAKLSLARANNVRNILEKALLNIGRTDVQFEVKAYGEDQAAAQFSNTYPEERFYNRTVTIDILPR